jgi:hypothetical protein
MLVAPYHGFEENCFFHIKEIIKIFFLLEWVKTWPETTLFQKYIIKGLMELWMYISFFILYLILLSRIK